MGEKLLWLLVGTGLCLLVGRQLLRRRAGARRVAEHAEAQRRAELHAEEQRQAAERAAAERSAAEQRREAAEQAERAAALEAERQSQCLAAQQAADEAQTRRQAERRAEQDRLAAELAEAERSAAERRRQAAEQAERERVSARAAELEAQRLAAEQAAREAQAKAQAARLAERRAVKTAAQTLVMVADDSKVVRIKTGRLLAQHQYQVAYASDGLDAVQQMQLKLPDVLITDVEMPGLDGFELTRQLRADPRTAQLPVIMITAADDRHREQADAAGVSVLLGKPYPEDALLAHIRSAMGQDAAAAQAGGQSTHGVLDALA